MKQKQAVYVYASCVYTIAYDSLCTNISSLYFLVITKALRRVTAMPPSSVDVVFEAVMDLKRRAINSTAVRILAVLGTSQKSAKEHDRRFEFCKKVPANASDCFQAWLNIHALCHLVWKPSGAQNCTQHAKGHPICV